MGEKLSSMQEMRITSQHNFQPWLATLPQDRFKPASQVLSCRAALRVFPLMHTIFSSEKYSPGEQKRLLLSALRATLVSRFAARYPAQLSISTAIAASAYQKDLNAPLSAVSAAFAADCAASSVSDEIIRAAVNSVGIAAEAAGKSATDIWASVTDDARWLTAGLEPIELLVKPLWSEGKTPEWWLEAKRRFEARLGLVDRESSQNTQSTAHWKMWTNWYQSIASARTSWKASATKSWKLEERIASGDGRGEVFWNRDPEEINREIAGWMDEKRLLQSNAKGPVFISYSGHDKPDTIRIGRIIEDIGFDVFAQYKDMPPGSNFITEMNKGLDGMGKFVPVYSPDYVTSKACAAEWNAAFNMDRDGERRLIIGFMLRPATLPPLYRQIVHIPLYNLTEPQLRDAVRDALNWDGEKSGSARSREIAAEAALPAPTINMQGQIDIEASPLEAPFIDDDLARVPESMRRHIETLLEALEGSNCSRLLTRSLKNYLLELTAHGATPNLPDLIRAAELIENAQLDAEEDGESWYKRTSKTALEQFAAMHEQLKQHFPLIMLRDISIDRTSIEPDRFDEQEFAEAHKVLTEAATEAHQAGAMSDDYYAVMELRERQRRDIESLRVKPQPDLDTVFLHPADRKTSEDIKKRFLFDVSGSSDKLLSKTAQASQIADSDAIKGLIKAAGDLLKSIWG